ncbi:MAG: potassium transporter TrkG [Nitriliruptor sp.]|uniref:potassium transporter TrkG n=1 Tax=Nitriliruptor sp. TaxID=2448056 RepID=UPI0034A0A90B
MEGREERIVPNIVRTARFIFIIATAYLVVGAAGILAALERDGLGGWRGPGHASNLFFAAFDTGGFAPTSQSVAYYHSVGLEAVIMVLMVAGTISFALHHQLWLGRTRQLTRDLEVRSLAVTLAATAALALFGLARSGAYSETVGLFRKGFFTILSAHTGTGFAVTGGGLFVTDWGALAPAAVVGARAAPDHSGSRAAQLTWSPT